MRNSVIKSLSLSLVAAAAMLMQTAPAQAQYRVGSGNSEIGTIGDIPTINLSPKIKQLPGLNLRPVGLFPDSEIYPYFDPDNAPAPFIFGLPNFGETMDFTGVTFEEYLETVARSYRVQDLTYGTSFSDVDVYFDLFTRQNEVTHEFPDFIPTFSQVLQVHQQDFLAGGGYLPIPNETRQAVDPPEDPIEFEPFPNDGTIGFDPIDPVVPDSPFRGNSEEESTAAAVSVVPEPATLGLLTLGAAACLSRRRR